ncbi:midasin [Streptomyces laurentii]|uniref:Midasin n=1 Tax=Streptomyces laurentii TaxID=39478 RepID=A0A160P7L4_STRLU|nr:midasin [Streptomyces laurentii]
MSGPPPDMASAKDQGYELPTRDARDRAPYVAEWAEHRSPPQTGERRAQSSAAARVRGAWADGGDEPGGRDMDGAPEGFRG